MTRSRSTWIGGCLAAGVVIGGHYWGRYSDFAWPSPTKYTYVALFACGLMFLDVVSLIAPPRDETPFLIMVGKAGSLAYSVGVVWFEPFYYVHGTEAIVTAYLVLLPMLLAIIYLARYQVWASAVLMSVFVLACSGMLKSNLTITDFGSGFFGYWLS